MHLTTSPKPAGLTVSLLQQALEVEGDAEPEDAGVDLRAGQASL